MIASLALDNVATIALVANFGIVFSYMLTGRVAISRRTPTTSAFRSPGYPYVQIFSVLLSTVMLLALGAQSLMLGAVTLLAGILVHATYMHFKAERTENT